MKNILMTRQLRVLRVSEDASEIEIIKAENDTGTMADTAINLYDVTGVAESVEDNGEVDPEQTVLMYGSDEVVIESPYQLVLRKWLRLHGEDEQE